MLMMIIIIIIIVIIIVIIIIIIVIIIIFINIIIIIIIITSLILIRKRVFPVITISHLLRRIQEVLEDKKLLRWKTSQRRVHDMSPRRLRC